MCDTEKVDSSMRHTIRDSRWQPWLLIAVFLATYLGATYFLLFIKEEKPRYEVVNGQQGHVITYWDWNALRIQNLEKYIEQYQDVTGGRVKVRTLQIGWYQYWQKIVAASVGEKPPTIIHMHNSRHSQLVDLLEPFPRKLFPLEEMRRQYFMFDGAFMHKDRLGEDQFYYHPGGLMTGLFFYNKDVWEDHGLTQADYPKTWDELLALSKRLTVNDDRNPRNIRVAGLNFNSYMGLMMVDIIYQQGGYMFSHDAKSILFDTPEAHFAARQANRFYEERVTSPRLPEYDLSFASYKRENKDTHPYPAMVYSWGWYAGMLNRQAPEIRWGVFPTPSLTNDPSRPLCRMNYEAAQAVMAGAPEEDKIEAFKFIKWLYEQDEYLIGGSISNGNLTGKMRLWDDPVLMEAPVPCLFRENIGKTVFVGEIPERIFSDLRGMRAMLIDRMPLETALEKANKVANERYRAAPSKWVVEREFWMERQDEGRM